jgi:nitrite reductase/ring-hydroxylating ferredoxin subunit
MYGGEFYRTIPLNDTFDPAIFGRALRAMLDRNAVKGKSMIELAKVSEIPEGGALRVKVEDKHIALFNVKGEIFAMNAICPHAGAFLDMGFLEDHTVICPLHGWDFDVRTGVSPNYGIKTRCYQTEIKDGVVYLKDPPPAAPAPAP